MRVNLKMIFILWLISSIITTLATNDNVFVDGSFSASPQPEQIHISRTVIPSEMMITWTTIAPTATNLVEYGIKGQALTNTTKADSKPYKTCGWKKRYIHIHRAKLTKLLPSTTYEYRCGGKDGWSALFFFKTTEVGSNWSPSLAVYGDLGVGNPQSLSNLQTEAQNGKYDAILHVGDFAYDMAHDESRVGDAFLNQIETIAAYVPYMVCPGNHEHHCNFSNYRERFSMPGGNQGLFYSWNIGPAHIVSFSTELYYFLQYGIEQLVNQYKWLQKDLEWSHRIVKNVVEVEWIRNFFDDEMAPTVKANLPQNRAIRPWIITMGHRPMYCSNIAGDGCQNHENEIRTGITSLKLFPLEELFYLHGVDLEFWAHEHSYERLYPVYNHKMYNGSSEHPYINPRAPVHITTGSAGCKYCHDNFKRDYGPWTAFRTLDYGYTRMKIHNFTHLYLEQVSIDKNYKVVDHVWIIKDKHGQEAWVADDVITGIPTDANSSFKPNAETLEAINEIDKTGKSRSKISKDLNQIIEKYTNDLKQRNNPYR